MDRPHEQLYLGPLSDGSRYAGLVNKSGKPNGLGSSTYLHNGQYFGDFQDGLRQGFGVYSFPSGVRYDGQFAAGDRCGAGVQITPDGYIYAGYWDDDGRHGYCSHINPDGFCVQTYFNDDQQMPGALEESPGVYPMQIAIDAQFQAASARKAALKTRTEALFAKINTIADVSGTKYTNAREDATEVDKCRSSAQKKREKEVTLQLRREGKKITRSQIDEATYAAELKLLKKKIESKGKKIESLAEWLSIKDRKERDLLKAKHMLHTVRQEINNMIDSKK